MAGRVGVVTGGGGAIGRAVAAALAVRGVSVAVVDSDAAAADAACRAVAASGVPTLPITADVSKEADVVDLFESVVRHAGRVDYLVNAAGALARRAVADMTLEEWSRMLAVHLTGTFLCCREAVRRMRGSGGGAIVNVSSGLALRGCETAHTMRPPRPAFSA
jgi:NAD(P)-dependent dehydrogenase (short-subunit alcohol dehydrogenase family)